MLLTQMFFTISNATVFELVQYQLNKSTHTPEERKKSIKLIRDMLEM